MMSSDDDDEPVVVNIEGTKDGAFPVPLDQIKTEDDDVIYIDTETTMKYLTGQMSFEEFHALLDEIKEEPDIEEALQELEITATEAVDDQGSEQQGAGTREAGEGSQDKEKRQRVRSKTSLSNRLQGLMGEANVRFAHGEYQETISMCKEVIRQSPRSHEPYHTLGMVYDELGDQARSLQLYLISAHLHPEDHEEWVRLAEMSLEQDDIQQATRCYSKAITADKKNINHWWARCDLLEKQGEQTKANQGYEQILKLIPKDNHQSYLQLARDITKNYYQMKENKKAIATLETAINFHGEHFDVEDVNLLLELYITEKRFRDLIDKISEQEYITVQYEITEDLKGQENRKILDFVIPEELPIDFRSKLCVAMIHCDIRGSLLQSALLPLFREDIDDVGDLYLDVAEAYMDCEIYTEARDVLAKLVCSQKYNMAAVWLRYGQCLAVLGDTNKAILAYQEVVHMAPAHLEARVALSVLYQKIGNQKLALEILMYDEDYVEGKPVDLELWLPRSSMLFSQDKHDEFIYTARIILFAGLEGLINNHYLTKIGEVRSQKVRRAALKELLSRETYNSYCKVIDAYSYSSTDVENLWDLYIRLCSVLIQCRRFVEFQRIAILATILPYFNTNDAKAKELEFISFQAQVHVNDTNLAYNIIRDYVVKNPGNQKLWNHFNVVVNMSKDLRYNRFAIRLIRQLPDNLSLGYLNGHGALVTGTYKHALGEYVAVYRRNPRDPMISLCIGLVFCHLACQKYTSNRQGLVVQCCAFMMQYKELRGECQEVYYNIGRTMHQLSLLHAAIFYYRKALTLPPAIKGPEEEEFDLRQEIAFNLNLMYKKSGSDKLAAMITQQYMVI